MDTPETTTPMPPAAEAPMPQPAAGAGKNVLMGILAYIGPLIIVSYLAAKDDPFVKFHIKQGLVLIVIQVVIWLLSSALWSFWTILHLLNIVVWILAIIGIVNAAQGKEKELPLVGEYAHKFDF